MSLKIEEKKGDPKTLVLYWEGEIWRCVYKPLFVSGLRKISGDLSWKEFLEQFAALEQKIARRYAIWLLSRRSYLSSDLTAKLMAKGISESVALDVVSFCTAKGYVNDSQEITRLIAKEQRKGLAARAIYFKLKSKKGIDEHLIRQLLGQSSSLDQGVLKKWIDKYGKKMDRNDRTAKPKLIAKLCRRGFSLELVLKELGDI